MINSTIYRRESRKAAAKDSLQYLKICKVEYWNIPGKDLRPRMISCLLFCSEILSSDIIKPNITKEMNWLV